MVELVHVDEAQDSTGEESCHKLSSFIWCCAHQDHHSPV